jgi:hypothetical protein
LLEGDAGPDASSDSAKAIMPVGTASLPIWQRSRRYPKLCLRQRETEIFRHYANHLKVDATHIHCLSNRFRRGAKAALP